MPIHSTATLSPRSGGKKPAGEGCQELRPPVCQKTSSRSELDVYRSRFEQLSPRLGPLGRRESAPRLQEHSRCLSGALERVAEGRQRNRGFFSDLVRGASNACEGSKILTLLFRPRLVCSSLLRLRSSWKVNSENFAITEFYEVRGARMPPDEVKAVERAQANPETTWWFPGSLGEQTGRGLCPQSVCPTLTSPSVSDGPLTVTSLTSPIPAA